MVSSSYAVALLPLMILMATLVGTTYGIWFLKALSDRHEIKMKATLLGVSTLCFSIVVFFLSRLGELIHPHPLPEISEGHLALLFSWRAGLILSLSFFLFAYFNTRGGVPPLRLKVCTALWALLLLFGYTVSLYWVWWIDEVL